MKAIEYSALVATGEQADTLLELLKAAPGSYGYRTLREPGGLRVCSYFPLGDVDERAELAHGYRVITLPAHLPWPEPPAST